MELDTNGSGDKLLMFENKHLQQLIGRKQTNHPQDVQQSNARDYCDGARAGAA